MFPDRTPPYSKFSDPAEAAANQRRELTARQHSALVAKTIVVALAALLLTGFAIGGGWLLFSEFASPLIFALPQALGALILLAAGLLVLAAPFLLKATQLWVRVYDTWREVASRHIRRAEGRVTWTGDVYAAEVDGRRLRPIYNKLNLLPGDYHFFFLARSGWLLSAEVGAVAPAEYVRSNLQHALAQANHFDAETLDLNREGRLAGRQAFGALPMLLPHLVGVLPVALFLSVAPNNFAAMISDRATWPVVAVYGLVTAYSGWHVLAIVIDVLAGRVSAIEGVGQRVRTHWGRNYTVYYYEVDGRRFLVSRREYNALIVGVTYRLYYLPLSKIVVSIEPVKTG